MYVHMSHNTSPPLNGLLSGHRLLSLDLTPLRTEKGIPFRRKFEPVGCRPRMDYPRCCWDGRPGKAARIHHAMTCCDLVSALGSELGRFYDTDTFGTEHENTEMSAENRRVADMLKAE